MPTFLGLPREIRDQIYELNLVHGTVPIATTTEFLHTSYGRLSHVEPKNYREYCYCENCTTNTSSRVQPIIRRNTKRSVREVYSNAGTLRNIAGTLLPKLQQSYGQPEVNDSGFAVRFIQKLVIFDSRNLGIFLANKKIYQEASTIFYSRNKFDFGCWKHGSYSDSLKNALAFVQDRSKHALAHLKSIRLALGNRGDDKLWEEDWYHSQELKVLCEKLAYESRLIELNVGIFGTYHSSLPHPCLQQLSKIKGLQKLHIWICGRNEDFGVLESSLATIKAFRSQSLIGGDKMGEDGIEISEHKLITVSTWKVEGEYDEF